MLACQTISVAMYKRLVEQVEMVYKPSRVTLLKARIYHQVDNEYASNTIQIVEGIVFSEILTITNMLISVSIACAVWNAVCDKIQAESDRRVHPI